jgi:hypothetical protein
MVLAQTMNMEDTYREQSKLFRIAELTGVVKNPHDEHKLFPEQQQDGIIVSWENDRAVLSTLLWDRASWGHRLAIIQAALTIFDCIPEAPTAQLYWSFSPKVIDRADAGKLLSQWIDEGAPPVMEFIGFAVEDLSVGRAIRTIGLTAIFGHELDAIILSEPDHGAGKMVAHLAQDMLRVGPLNTSVAVGPDGRKYRLAIVPNSPSVANMVRITAV